MKEAVILAGGFGTRLRSVVSDVPKPMAPVAGRPFLEWLIDYLIGYGYTHLVLSTGYMADRIEQHFGSMYKGVPLHYAVEHEPLGTGGGIKNALSLCEQDTVTVLNGDTLFRVDYNALAAFHQSHSSRLTLFLRHVADTSRYGAVETDAQQRLCAFREKADSGGEGWINGGIYMMRRSLLDGYNGAFSFERDVMQARYATEPFYALPSDAYFIDIGVPEDYKRANIEFIQ